MDTYLQEQLQLLLPTQPTFIQIQTQQDMLKANTIFLRTYSFDLSNNIIYSDPKYTPFILVKNRLSNSIGPMSINFTNPICNEDKEKYGVILIEDFKKNNITYELLPSINDIRNYKEQHPELALIDTETIIHDLKCAQFRTKTIYLDEIYNNLLFLSSMEETLDLT